MGKALVIKNVNFATNKLATVELIDAIPCTGIVLNKAETSMTSIGSTETLVPTLTPANTTDYIIWTSSNPDVVSVSGGVLTQQGIGTATITATCGEHTASCAVEAVNTLDFVYELTRYNHVSDQTGADYIYNEAGSGPYCAILSNTLTDKILRPGDVTPKKCPIIIGSGASKVSINVPAAIRPTVWFLDSKTACDYSKSHTGYDDYAKVISGDASAYDSNVPLGPRTIDIPEGADSVVFSLQYPQNTITDEIMATVSIVAS